MKKRIIKNTFTEYYDQCDICGKEIKGTSENQVEYNIKIHKMTHTDNERVDKNITKILTKSEDTKNDKPNKPL